MNTSAIVLLLFVCLSGETFAGYSTGIRRPHKPKNPGTDVVHPSGEGHHDSSKETGKLDGGEIDIDYNGGIGPSDDKDIPTEDRKVPYDIAVDPGFKQECKCAKEQPVQPYPSGGFPSKDPSIDTGIKPHPYVDEDEYGGGKISDVPDVETKPHPYVDEDEYGGGKISDVPDVETKPHPYVDEDEYGGGKISDVPDVETKPHPYGDGKISDVPKNIGGDRIPLGIPDEDLRGSHPDKPADKDYPKDLEPHSEIEPDKEPTYEIGPIPQTELLEPYPMKVGGGNENINLYDLMNKLELSRFLHLVEEANLKDLLTSEEPLTIFAPSDYALSKLNADTIRKLATNQELLRQFVLYHCVDGKISGPSFEERDNSIMTTKFDRGVHVNRYGEGWFVNGKQITNKDQTCRNGVIHVMDNSLYPSPTGDLLETLEKSGNFKIFIELIRNAKLEKELTGEIAYTIFAPTDVAFSKLPPSNLEWLKWDIPAIKRLFRQVTVNGMYYTTWIPRGNGQLSSLDDTNLSLSGYPNSISVNDVPLSQYDITASNGCIHAIDDVWFLSELGTPSGPSEKKHHD